MRIDQPRTLIEKLNILSDAAKYDVACTSSGTDRGGSGQGMGNCIAAGICHSFSADGRCISLLKILMTNDCVFDCHYCVNRVSNDVAVSYTHLISLIKGTQNWHSTCADAILYLEFTKNGGNDYGIGYNYKGYDNWRAARHQSGAGTGSYGWRYACLLYTSFVSSIAFSCVMKMFS